MCDPEMWENAGDIRSTWIGRWLRRWRCSPETPTPDLGNVELAASEREAKPTLPAQPITALEKGPKARARLCGDQPEGREGNGVTCQSIGDLGELRLEEER